MITPQEFSARWQAEVVSRDPVPDSVKLLRATAHSLASARLPDATRRFLIEAGLPQSCAPFLCFGEVGEGLPRVWDVYAPRPQWRPEEKIGLEYYLMIGSEGSGNPICLDERNGSVVMLDHELLFDPKAREKRTVFVNSGIPELAECLLLFETSAPRARLAALGQADPPAVRKGAFWFSETDERPWWKFW